MHSTITFQQLNKRLTFFGVIIYFIIKIRICLWSIFSICQSGILKKGCTYAFTGLLETSKYQVFASAPPTLKVTSVDNVYATLAPSLFNTCRRHYYQRYLQALLTTQKNVLWIQSDLGIIIAQNLKLIRITRVKKIMQFL